MARVNSPQSWHEGWVVPGQDIAIDSDSARLERARTNLTSALYNVVFEQTSGEDLRQVDDRSLDLVYSNYAVHWILNLPAMFDEVEWSLRPGGRFVTEFLDEPIQLFIDLILMMPSGQYVTEENVFLDEAQWRELITVCTFMIGTFEWPQFTLDYKNLQSLFNWLQATSHDSFDARKISPKNCAAHEHQFPGEISIACKGLRMMLRWL